MEIVLGLIVKSCYGHDKGRYYAIVKIENNFVFISDGKSRKIQKPKKKNIKHLKLTKKVLEIAQIETNKKLHRALWEYNYTDAILEEGGDFNCQKMM